MRFRLLRRRLTISAPRMAVRSAMPWPVRWFLAAIVLGFCAAVALWAFEFGKGIAGLDRDARAELDALRAEVARLRDERDKAQSVANTSGSLLTSERVAQEKLALKLRQLEAENSALRDDLGFFEKLIPAGGGDGIAIRGLQAEVLPAPGGSRLRWQVLLLQPLRGGPVFSGKLELTVSGTMAGKPWSAPMPGGTQAVEVQQSRRLEGFVDIPPQVVVNNVLVRVVEGTTVRATQALKI